MELPLGANRYLVSCPPATRQALLRPTGVVRDDRFSGVADSLNDALLWMIHEHTRRTALAFESRMVAHLRVG